MPENSPTLILATAWQTWPSIAFDQWQDEMLFPTLMDANPELAEILVFEGGEPVIIPTEPENIVDKSHLPPWRQ